MQFLKESSKVFYVGKTEVIQNPTDDEYRQIYREQRKLHPNTTDPLIRQTYGEFGNYYIWPAYDNTHYGIELYIYKTFGERTNQNKDYDMFNHYYLDEAYLDADNKFYDYRTQDISNSSYIDVTRQEAPKYQDYLDYPEKTNEYHKTTSEIVEMTPREYFEQCAVIFGSNFESQYKQIKDDDGVIAHLKDVIIKYKKKFPITVLNYADNTQEGRHRMFVLGELVGWDKKFPVLVIKNTEEGLAAKKEASIIRELRKLIDRALEYTYTSVVDCANNLDWYLNDLKDYVEYETIDVMVTKKPSILIQVDNVCLSIEEHEIKIDPNKYDELDDELNIDDLMLDLTDEEKKHLNLN